MIQSMTAFARHESQGDWGSAVWELRSVNHRYLEASLRLPETLSVLEPLIRERLKARLQRGKIDIVLRYHAPNNEGRLAVNKEFVAQLIKARAEIAEQSALMLAPFNPGDILSYPGVLQVAALDVVHLTTTLMAEFERVLEQFIAVRRREGAALQNFFAQRLTAIQAEIAKVKKCLPVVLVEQREKLLARFAETKLTLDSARLEQEMVLFAQKIDVTEELERLHAHLTEMQRVLSEEEAVGRRLDFLLQESNREVNTLGAKSVNMEITLAVVELKVLLEQLREQTQNIE